MEKEQKRKPKYGMFSCVAYIYKMLWKYERGLAFTSFFTVPLSLMMSALALYIPSIILHYLEKSDRFSTICLVIIGLLLADMLFSLANNIINEKTAHSEHYIILRMIYQRKCRIYDRDFYLSYDPEVKLLDERARNAIQNNHTDAVHFPMDFANLVATVLKFLLFGAVVSLLNPWIILLLITGCVVNFILSAWERKRNYETQDERNKIRKKLNYLSMHLSRDFQFGKEIRIYHFSDYLSLLAKKLQGEYRVEREKVELRSIVSAVVSFLIVFVRDSVAYGFLIYKAISGEIDAAQFVLYFSAITSTSEVLSNILGTWSHISEGTLQISDYREDLEVQDKLNRGEGIPLPQGAFSIEFKHVSYKYPKSEKYVLENISFKIEAGEKIALVGLNGAGKTTLTKLMCGLCVPTEGEILIDGHNLSEYNRDEMYTLFGLVPQDYHLLPVSISKNIAVMDEEDKIDRDRLTYCIEMAGLTEKIASLPMGTDTPLNRQVNADGIELSGGEIQKLLLARLLYRHPQCMILDEPTAALDPIAENRMYHKYNEITSDTTSVFISHRLASTRFCDRIFFLDGARFAEVGTHEELMAAGKKYRELFDIQSKYYREGADKDEE